MSDDLIEQYENAVSDFIIPESLTADNHEAFEEHCRACCEGGLTPKACAERWGARPMN